MSENKKDMTRNENSTPKRSRKGGNIANLCYDLALPVVEEHGLYLWDVSYVKEGAQWYLRVFIDKENEPISLSDCVEISHKLDPILDKADPIRESYCLEVCSPGMERALTLPEHFDKYVGEAIKVKLIRPLDGERIFKGYLERFNDNIVTLKNDEDETIDFDMKDIVSVNILAFGDDE